MNHVMLYLIELPTIFIRHKSTIIPKTKLFSTKNNYSRCDNFPLNRSLSQENQHCSSGVSIYQLENPYNQRDS